MPNPPSEAKPPNADPPPRNNLTPLAMILTTMRRHWDKSEYDAAIALARIAAPYLHPRLPASAPTAELAVMTDADLDAVRPQD